MNWDKIRNTDSVYPKKSLAVIVTKTESGKPATGWINFGYEDYKFKKYCPCNLQFEIWIEDLPSEPEEMAIIEEYFVKALQKECIVHKVARVSTDFGMIMDFYIDNPEYARKVLGELYENEDKIVEFGCGLNHDPNWEEYDRIISNWGKKKS